MLWQNTCDGSCSNYFISRIKISGLVASTFQSIFILASTSSSSSSLSTWKAQSTFFVKYKYKSKNWYFGNKPKHCKSKSKTLFTSTILLPSFIQDKHLLNGTTNRNTYIMIHDINRRWINNVFATQTHQGLDKMLLGQFLNSNITKCMVIIDLYFTYQLWIFVISHQLTEIFTIRYGNIPLMQFTGNHHHCSLLTWLYIANANACVYLKPVSIEMHCMVTNAWLNLNHNCNCNYGVQR